MCGPCRTRRTIREWIERGTPFLAGMYNYSGIQLVKPTRRAVVVGGGFIGLEMAENLVHLGFDVTLVEMLDQVLAPLDREIAHLVEGHLTTAWRPPGAQRRRGRIQAQVDGGALEVQTNSGKTYPADIVILALGVRPDTTLAKAAGLEIGERGGIRVDEHMRTSDPDIFAVGDAIEVKDFVTGQWSLIALAGPANRQGRIAADVIAGRDSRYRGTQGTSIIGLFGGAAAWTGVSEKTLKRLGDTDYEKIYLFPNSHAGYYPGAKMIGMKVIFRKSNGTSPRRAGAGQDGPAVDKRISALAMAIQMGATIYDLEEVRALLRAAVRQREGSGQLRRDGRRRRPARRHAAHSLGFHGRCIPAGRARAGGIGRRERAGRGQHPAGSAPLAPRRTPPRPRDPRHLPFRPARLLRDAHPAAERVQSQEHLRRHAVARHAHGGYEVKAG